MDRGTCKTCGAPIIWVVMEGTGRPMPVDAGTIERRIVLDGTKTKGAIRSVGVSHFSTCPDANKHRRKTED